MAEFCCDDHEREYKDLALKRLASAAESEAETPPKPLVLPASASPPEAEREPAAAHETAEAPAATGERAPAAVEEISDREAEDLWQLADQIGVGEETPPTNDDAISPANPAQPKAPRLDRNRRRGRRSKGGAAAGRR